MMDNFFRGLIPLCFSWEWLPAPDDIKGQVCVNRRIGYVSSDFNKGYL